MLWKIYVWKLERKKNEQIKGWIGLTVPWEKCDEKFSFERLLNDRMTEGQGKSSIAPTFSKWGYKKGWISSSSSLTAVYMIYPPIVHVCTKFQLSMTHNSWEKGDKMFNVWKLERKKTKEIKKQISSSSLILVYRIHPPIEHVCNKFQPSRPHSSWEKCDKNVWKL